MLALLAASDKPEHVALGEAPPPFPEPDEAVLQVRAFGINRGELNLLASRPVGWRPGQDIAGIVVRQAADGSGPPDGARVVAMVDQAGWAELVAAPTSRIGILPDGVSFEQAATLPVAGLTALRALRLGNLLVGRRVLITGASGGVGHFAVQLAVAAGAHVTGAIGHAENGPVVLELGAEEVVTTVEQLSGSYDLILESVGGAWLTAAVRSVSADGIVAFFGNSSREPSTFSFTDFRGHPRARLCPFFIYESGPPAFGVDLTLLASLIAEGKLKPEIGFTASWRQLDEGLTGLRDRRFPGKAVLTLD